MEQPQDITQVKKPRGRPRIPDDQRKVYVQKPRPGYHTKYYHDSLLSKDVKCELCNCTVTLQKLKRHQTSKKCKELASYRIELIEDVDEEI
jgi:hypothetical protein